ncbi:MAG: DUF3352 domain-containing protein [Hormoscilla sp. GM102CHS1]|nr:DUF3352 domain-containing protein [Hormoscilla sp. GM102CHS1]
MTKNQKTPLLLAAGAAALLIASGTAYWFLAQKQEEVPDTMPVGVDVVPQDALMSISMTTNQEQWQKLRQFGTPETQAAFDARLVELRDRLLTANGYDFFKQTVPLALEPNNGHFFIDVDRVFALNILTFPIVPYAQKTVLNAIRSIGVTTAVKSDRTTRYDIFIGLKQGDEPGVLPSQTEPVPRRSRGNEEPGYTNRGRLRGLDYMH